jgi:RNase H-fold protein (predicted Holliday junction resolvase)
VTGTVLGIDPGTRKVGFAVVTGSAERALEQGIEPVDGMRQRLEVLRARYPLEAVALGDGTNVSAVRALLEMLGVPIHLVDESDTTYRARRLYFADHPPRGWRRLLPLGLQVPERPIDDYAALLIARRYAGLQ